MAKRRPTIELICAYTGETFLKDRREYDRQVREGATVFYKNRKIAGIANGEKRRLALITRQCPQCNKSFEVYPTKKSKRFCSKSCQGSHQRAQLMTDPVRYEEYKRKTSESVKKAWTEGKFDETEFWNTRGRTPLEKRKCPICSTSFECKTYSNKRTCGNDVCVREIMSRQAKANPNCGGETNYKRYYYKDIMFDSSWEVEIAQWLDSKQIRWERTRKLVLWWTDDEGKKRRYHPDFYLPELNVYLDPKNKYLIEKDRAKIERAIAENNVRILWGVKDEVLEALQLFLRH